jgi:hypothetical protein
MLRTKRIYALESHFVYSGDRQILSHILIPLLPFGQQPRDRIVYDQANRLSIEILAGIHKTHLTYFRAIRNFQARAALREFLLRFFSLAFLAVNRCR